MKKNLRYLRNLKSLNSLKTLILWMSLACLGACSWDNDNIPDTANAGAPLTVQVAVQGFSPDTRASDDGYTTSFISGDQIGITIVQNGTTIMENNIPYQFDGSTWQPVNDKIHFYSGTISYIACYPYNTAMNDKKTEAEIFNAFTLQTDQSAYADYTASDLMTGSGTLTGVTLNFTLAHKLALIEFALPAGSTGATLKVGDATVMPYLIATDTYRCIVSPETGVSLSGSYSISGETANWQKTGVNLTSGQYTLLNVVNPFYTGTILVKYSDGDEETVSLAPDGTSLPVIGTGKTVKEIVLTDAGKTYLIGRKVDATSIKLNLKINGDLAFRPAVNGSIPIGSYAEFQLINTVPNALSYTYKQEADLDLMGNLNPAVEWTTVGIEDYPFSGTFDGNGKNISNLYINKPGTNNIGLFGYISNATIKNVHIANGSVSGKYAIGSVVGYNRYGTITACYNHSDVSGVERVGGVVGNNRIGPITACYNTGAVSGGNSIGGVVGYNDDNAPITTCYNTGSVSGGNYIGGVVGYNYYSPITACYNIGAVVSSGNYIGGVVGVNQRDPITACYNTGDISGSDYIGGVAGVCDNAPITACYNTGDISGNKELGGVVGRNYSGPITACYNTGDISGNGYLGGVVGHNYYSPIVTACYWANYSGNGIGDGSGGDAIKFSSTAWPAVGSEAGKSSQWGIGDGSGSGKYWKIIGSWNNGNPAYPKLWWE